MRRLLVALLLPAAVTGCADRPPPLIKQAVEVKAEPAEGEVTVPTAADKPQASDPAAAAVVRAALDAATNGNRGLVQRFRTVEYARAGRGRSLEESPLGLTWKVACAWPDRFRVEAEFPGPLVATLAWDGRAGWQQAPGRAAVPFTQKEAEDFRADAAGEWVWLLFPLADGDAVVSAAPPLPGTDPPAPGVNLFHPQLAPCVVHFDPQTKLLARITFQGREAGSPGVKEFRVVESKEHHGVKLAHRLAQTFRGKQYADWTLTSLDPRPALPADRFAPPK